MTLQTRVDHTKARVVHLVTHLVNLDLIVIGKARVVHIQIDKINLVHMVIDRTNHQAHMVIAKVSLVALLVQIDQASQVLILEVVHLVEFHKLLKIIIVLTKVDRTHCIRLLCQMPTKDKVSLDLYTIKVVLPKPLHIRHKFLLVMEETHSQEHFPQMFHSQVTAINGMVALQ